MIIIDKTTRDDIKKFNNKEWHGVDIEHYGKPVEWNDQDFIFKATDDGQIIGTITGKFESGVLYIDSLIIAKAKRGLGIGKKLTEKAEDFGRKLKGHKAHLITGKDWAAAKFYEALGYVKIADLPNHHFRKDFVIYEKTLE